jgi:DNA polymerase-3 subunit gamma/tau
VSPVDKIGEPPLADQRRTAKAEQAEKDRAHPAFDHPLLKNAKLLEITDRSPNVIAADFKSGDET